MKEYKNKYKNSISKSLADSPHTMLFSNTKRFCLIGVTQPAALRQYNKWAALFLP